MEKKFEILINNLKLMSNKGICIAFSGGVDSCLLTYICKEFNITAITINTPFQTKEEINNCIEFCQKYNIKHKIININTLENEIISNNPIDRCYHCKKTIFSVLKNFCKNENIEYILDGTNADDINVYRPGLKALN